MVGRSPRVRNDGGKTKMGCLLVLVLLGASVYYGIAPTQSQIRYVQMKDYMRTQARFATNLDDDVIRRRLRDKSTELHLPTDAHRISIRRRGRPREIIISTTWQDTLPLPFRQLIVTRKPEARSAL